MTFIEILKSERFHCGAILNHKDFLELKLPYNYLKIRRIIELLIILVLLPFLLSISFISIIILRISTKGSVFYSDNRPGKEGNLIKIYKFKTMLDNSEYHVYKHNEERVTSIGKFFRKHRIDEIPQMINVIIGNMSLIGPRPEYIHYFQACCDKFPEYRHRFLINPGITGWAQVHFKHTDSVDEAYKKLCYDYFYLKNLSWKLDLIILFRTISVIFTGCGAR